VGWSNQALQLTSRGRKRQEAEPTIWGGSRLSARALCRSEEK